MKKTTLICAILLLTSMACQSPQSPNKNQEASEKLEQKEATTPKEKSVDENNEATAKPEAGATQLTGHYLYYADAGIFYPCTDGKPYPVATEGANAEMEKGYLAMRQKDLEKIFVRVEGQLVERGKMEGDGKTLYLVVEQVLGFERDGDCGE